MGWSHWTFLRCKGCFWCRRASMPSSSRPFFINKQAMEARRIQMLAIVNSPKGPEPVAIREVAEPEPRPNEALVAVHAFSLNRGELRLFQVRPEGWRPGQDIAGVVLRAASDGSGPAVGSRIVALCDWEGWAERAAVPSHRIAPIADNVTFGAAASLPVAGLTALRSLRHGAPPLGKPLLITAPAAAARHLPLP